MTIPAAAWPAIGSIGGSIIGGLFGKSADDKQIRLADKQMEFQKMMSNTAVQRRMVDLKKLV